MKNIGLYFGSFNPIHNGHLAVAEFFATKTHLNEVWLVVSPHSPFKSNSELAPETDRLKMVALAIADKPNIKASDFEFLLPKPSYTCNTLRSLSAAYPNDQFTILLGEDNKHTFHLWKDYLWILENYTIRFFPRQQHSIEGHYIDWEKYDAHIIDAPRIKISSTQIRENISLGKSNQGLVPTKILDFISKNHLYTKI